MFMVHLQWPHRTHNYPEFFFFFFKTQQGYKVNTSSVASVYSESEFSSKASSEFIFIHKGLDLLPLICLYIPLLIRADEPREELNILTLVLAM